MTTTQPERAAAVAQSLAGKVAIVTGAAKGLEAAISASLVEQGAWASVCAKDRSGSSPATTGPPR